MTTINGITVNGSDSYTASDRPTADGYPVYRVVNAGGQAHMTPVAHERTATAARKLRSLLIAAAQEGRIREMRGGAE